MDNSEFVVYHNKKAIPSTTNEIINKEYIFLSNLVTDVRIWTMGLNYAEPSMSRD